MPGQRFDRTATADPLAFGAIADIVVHRAATQPGQLRSRRDRRRLSTRFATYGASPLRQQKIPREYFKMPADERDARIWALRNQLGDRLVILGHHYQRDEVIQFADFRGDSFKLSQQAATAATPNSSSSAACTSWPKAPICSPSRSSR